MFYEPSEIKAADKVTAFSRGCVDQSRLMHTPEDDIELAMLANPEPGRGIRNWIDPKLAAVYIIGNTANSLFKIGYARDLRKRVLSIQGSCPVPVCLYHFVYVVGTLIAKRLEASVHEAFAEERKHGEWFEVHPEDAAYILAELINESRYVWWDEKERRNLGFAAATLHQKDWERYSRRGHAHD